MESKTKVYTMIRELHSDTKKDFGCTHLNFNLCTALPIIDRSTNILRCETPLRQNNKMLRDQPASRYVSKSLISRMGKFEVDNNA